MKLKMKNMKQSELLQSRFNFSEFTKKVRNSKKCENNSSERRVKKVRQPLLPQHKTISPPKYMNPFVKWLLKKMTSLKSLLCHKNYFAEKDCFAWKLPRLQLIMSKNGTQLDNTLTPKLGILTWPYLIVVKNFWGIKSISKFICYYFWGRSFRFFLLERLKNRFSRKIFWFKTKFWKIVGQFFWEINFFKLLYLFNA